MNPRLVIGIQPVREAIRAHGARLTKVMVERGAGRELDAVARFAEDQGAAVARVDRAELDRIARGGRHQGVLALAPELELVALDDIDAGEGACIVALDELEDPQNFGAILRSAVALGATAVVWPEHHSAPLTPATFRASAGAVERATLCRVTNLASALQALRARGVSVIGLDAAASEPIATIPLAGPVALVVGAEGKGLRRGVKQCCDRLARLPMPGPIGSLNASVSAAIALYEVLRQRTVLA